MIVGYAELLRMRDDPVVRREAPERILEAAERLSRGLDDLLATLGERPPASAQAPRE